MEKERERERGREKEREREVTEGLQPAEVPWRGVVENGAERVTFPGYTSSISPLQTPQHSSLTFLL